MTGIKEITTGGRTGVTIVGTSANQVMDFSTMVLDGIGLIDAGAGNDTVTGGTGNDRLTGGAGADIFRLTALTDSNLAGRDVVLGFSAAEGDKFDLSAIDARPDLPGDQAFVFGGSGLVPLRGQITFIVIGGGTGAFIIGETNGDGTPDFQIELIGTGIAPFTEADFIL